MERLHTGCRWTEGPAYFPAGRYLVFSDIPNDRILRWDETTGAVSVFRQPAGYANGHTVDRQGHQAQSEIGACLVYRIDPVTGTLGVVADDFERPNGLAFSADERQLYIADSRRKHIRVFGVTDAAVLSGGEVFATCHAGTFDGVRLDAAGRIWAAAADGLHCFDPDGTLIGKLRVPETVANFTFGGAKRNHLFICATSSLYSILVNVTGARYPR